jgi:hypothetical protein
MMSLRDKGTSSTSTEGGIKGMMRITMGLVFRSCVM